MVFTYLQLVFTFLLLLLLLVVTQSTLSINGNVNDQKNGGASKPFQVEDEASINLKSILEHQEGLALECAKYHEFEVKKLKYVIKFNDSHESVQLPSPLPVQVPAVCLFLFSQFGQSKSMDSAKGKTTATQTETTNKLEMVNWIYNEDELRKSEAEVDTNRTKRQTGEKENSSSSSSSFSSLQSQARDFLADFLLNRNAPEHYMKPLNNNDNNNNEVDTRTSEEAEQEKAKVLHKQIEKLMADERFQRTIDDNRQAIGAYLSPVILIPGLLGSRLQAKTDKIKRVNIFCQKQSNWQEMWLSVRQLLPLAVDCWIDNVRLDYNPLNGFTKSPIGVKTRVPDFGSVESVRHLDLNQPQITQYYAAIIERYEQLGYTVDKNLLAAPYDFRLAPQELFSTYYVDLKNLIEKAKSDSTSGKGVTLVCHSMGCTHLLIFLRRQTAAWRQSHIRKVIALSSPWGGAIKAFKALIVGDQLNLPLISESKMRKLARSYPSISFLLPQEEIFSRPNKNFDEPGGPILLQTPERSYKVADMELLFRDLNLTRQFEWFKKTAKLIKPLKPLPDVPMDCIHSLNIPTPETLIFANQTDFPNGNYELIKGEGDGTVNFESLMVCEDWARKLPDKITHKIIMNTNHVGVLIHKTTLEHITDDVLTN